jgi:oligopeptide/dipeptide ABC transporter ATP-binding protein
VQKICPRREIKGRIEELCKDVNLPLDILSKYPHELDGGKRQTVGIARALSLNPKLIICDEPVSSLDVSIQAQIINILMDLREKRKLTYLFISHDLSVVKHISTNIKVMYLGKIMEEAKSDDLFENPQHPYTKALLSAVPSVESTSDKKRIILEGDVPSPINPPSGCRFCKRCWLAQEICFNEEPLLEETGQEEHRVACHFAEKMSKKAVE